MMRVKEPVILITGANGQIGQVLSRALREDHGHGNVILSDLQQASVSNDPFEILDINDTDRLRDIIRRHNVNQVYHLAALLSSRGEKNPMLTWQINFDAYLRLLEVCREENIDRVFFPSTIGIYGPTTPRQDTPQHASFMPATVYGISKLTGEMWSEYYRKRYGLDVRGIRYPGVISYQSVPSGGTTDFAVEMFFKAIGEGHYTCYLKPETRLPMVYMPDVITGTLKLMRADRGQISIASAYNLAAFSVTPAELHAAIEKHIPGFSIAYEPDERQAIADSWSETIDDSLARRDWGWQPAFDMETMVSDMVENVRKQLRE